MRFRLATAPSQNFGQGFAALGMLPMLRQQAEEEAQGVALKRQGMEAQIARQMAAAAVDEEKRKQLAGRGDTFDTILSARSGADIPTINRWRETQRTGVQPMTGSPTGFPEMDELIGITPKPAIDPAVAQRIASEIARVGPAMVNPDDYTVQGQADASGKYQTQDLLERVLQGQVDPGRAGSAVAASKGAAQVNNIGNTGAGFNIHTGEGAVLDEALRTLFGQQGAALVNQRNAAAGNSNASAGLSNARRTRVEGGYGNAPVTIVDDDTGEASVTRLPTGAAPVTVGVAPKKATGKDATLQKERNRVVRDVEKEMYGATEAEIAAEVERRMARRGGAAPAKPPAAAAPNIDMKKAAEIKAKVKAGTLTREQGVAELRALGFK